MVTIKYWKLDKTEGTIEAPTNGQAMDKAETLGAIRIQDGLHMVYLSISGEWYSLPFQVKAS